MSKSYNTQKVWGENVPRKENRKYIGFYLFPNYWIGEDLNPLLEKYQTSGNDEILKEIKQKMRKEVISYKNSNHELILCGDGLILFRDYEIEEKIKDWEEKFNHDIMTPFSPVYEAWAEYIKISNIIYFSIDCASHYRINYYVYEFRELNRNDFLRITYRNGKLHRQTDYSRNSLYAVTRLDPSKDTFKHTAYNGLMSQLDIFNDMYNVFFKKIISDDEAIEFISALSKSLSEHNLKNYNISLVLSWFLIEAHISELWKIFISGCNSERRKKLTGRDYSVSVQIEMLELNKRIDTDQYKRLDFLRKIRNKIIHDNYKCSKSQSEEALTQAREIAKKKFEIDFPFNISGHSTLGL